MTGQRVPVEQLTRHIMIERNPDAMTGVCRLCGPVDLLYRGGSYRCGNKVRNIKREHMLARYGITDDEYQQKYDEQEGKCLICKTWFAVLHVDHCHVKKEFRALLCGNCNRGLGMFHDEPLALRAAAAYLERFAA